MQDWMLLQKEQECVELRRKLDETVQELNQAATQNALWQEKMHQQEQRMQHELRLIKIAALQQRQSKRSNYNNNNNSSNSNRSNNNNNRNNNRNSNNAQMVVVSQSPHDFEAQQQQQAAAAVVLDGPTNNGSAHSGPGFSTSYTSSNTTTSPHQSPSSKNTASSPTIATTAAALAGAASTSNASEPSAMSSFPGWQQDWTSPSSQQQQQVDANATANATAAPVAPGEIWGDVTPKFGNHRKTSPTITSTTTKKPLYMQHRTRSDATANSTDSYEEKDAFDSNSITWPTAAAAPAAPAAVGGAASMIVDPVKIPSSPKSFTKPKTGPLLAAAARPAPGQLRNEPMGASNKSLAPPAHAAATKVESDESSYDMVENIPKDIHMDGEAPPAVPLEENITFGTSTFGTLLAPQPTVAVAAAAATTTAAAIHENPGGLPPPPPPRAGGVSFVDDSASVGHTVASSTYGEDRQKVTRLNILDPYGDKGRYSGIVLRSTGMPHGSGLMEYEEDGRIYEGEWRHGRYVAYSVCCC